MKKYVDFEIRKGVDKIKLNQFNFSNYEAFKNEIIQRFKIKDNYEFNRYQIDDFGSVKIASNQFIDNIYLRSITLLQPTENDIDLIHDICHRFDLYPQISMLEVFFDLYPDKKELNSLFAFINHHIFFKYHRGKVKKYAKHNTLPTNYSKADIRKMGGVRLYRKPIKQPDRVRLEYSFNRKMISRLGLVFGPSHFFFPQIDKINMKEKFSFKKNKRKQSVMKQVESNRKRKNRIIFEDYEEMNEKIFSEKIQK